MVTWDVDRVWQCVQCDATIRLDCSGWTLWRTLPVWITTSDLVTNLWREDVVGYVPHSLLSAHVGVAHSFHFGKDGADGRVCGLVTFLVDEHPPVRDKGRNRSGPSPPQIPATPLPSIWAHRQGHSVDLDMEHCNLAMPTARLTRESVELHKVVDLYLKCRNKRKWWIICVLIWHMNSYLTK